MSVFTIGEIGINHNGDISLAKKLIDECSSAGFNAVKFQKRTIDIVYTKDFLDSPRESPWGTTQRHQKEGLEFSKEQYELKQVEFDILQKKLAEFKDSNKSISTASFMSELQKLESEYQLQQSILINLASEYNNNKIKLNKDTPIFSVIDEVSVPNERSKPVRSLLVIIFVFLGLVLSIIYVLGKEPTINLIKKIKD